MGEAKEREKRSALTRVHFTDKERLALLSVLFPIETKNHSDRRARQRLCDALDLDSYRVETTPDGRTMLTIGSSGDVNETRAFELTGEATDYVIDLLVDAKVDHGKFATILAIEERLLSVKVGTYTCPLPETTG